MNHLRCIFSVKVNCGTLNSTVNNPTNNETTEAVAEETAVVVAAFGFLTEDPTKIRMLSFSMVVSRDLRTLRIARST